MLTAVASPKRPWRLRATAEEYLSREERADAKHEFWHGRIAAMPGVSQQHGAIGVNFMGEAYAAFKGTDCRPWSSDMRLRTAASGLYTYPDAAIVRGEPQFAAAPGQSSHTLLNPTVLVEILSKSTERRDRGFKFEQYRTLPSLREYLMVQQHRPMAELYARQADETWALRTFAGLDAVLEFASVPFRLPLADLYRDVAFPLPKPRLQKSPPAEEAPPSS